MYKENSKILSELTNWITRIYYYFIVLHILDVSQLHHSADRTDGGSTVTITACAERGAYRVI